MKTLSPFLFYLFICSSSMATTSECSDSAWEEMPSLKAVPEEIATLLGKGRPGLEGIADRGEPFNVTDVIYKPLPAARFTLGAINARCAVVAIEYGGIAHGWRLLTFRQVSGHWTLQERHDIKSEPKSIASLLAAQ